MRNTTKERSRYIRCTTACALAGTVLIGQRASAQSTPELPADDHALVAQLLKRVEELEQQVKALRQSNSDVPQGDAVGTAEATSEQEPTAPADASGEMHDSDVPSGAGLKIRGFADIDFHTIQGDSAPNTFLLGQLDLLLTSRLSDEFSFVGEVVLEANEANAFGIDIERMMLQYAPSNYFKVSAGRYHTAIGYYNTAYHHGNWFQTTGARLSRFWTRQRFSDLAVC